MKKGNAVGGILGGGLVTLVINAVNIGVLLSENAMIINMGAKAYYGVRGTTIGLAVGATVLYVGFCIATIIKGIKEKRPVAMEEMEPSDGMLSASGKLSDEYVLRQVVNYGRTKWKCLENEISALAEQLVLMNSYQDRLSKLLANNSAQALSDTENILERIEQQVLGNTRKVLNFMEILGTDDRQKVSEYLKTCVQDNKKLLDATKDFLICVTGFLNDQGTNGDANLQMVEDFKAVLMGNIGGAAAGSDSDQGITLNL